MIQSQRSNDNLNHQQLLLIMVLSVVLGIVWIIYGWFYSLIAPILQPLNLTGLLNGIYISSGGCFAIIFRKKYSALLGEIIPSCVEMIASPWGIYNLLYGLFQGLVAEAVFLLLGYKKAKLITMLLANICSNIISFFLSYVIYNYAKFSFYSNLIRFILEIASTLLFSLLLFKVINLLKKLGYINSY